VKLYVEPMDAVLVEFDHEGRVRFDGEEWTVPTVQEQRAILYAAQNHATDIQELIQALARVFQP
jgi:hypothetical protein